ncbi:MAG TPA: phosphoribosylanthranilate isomerase [Candidatus Limnocylindrales bacterium]|nr:phosphoribosylanthranilate isomerase [Candidatus Limnocylindrales bacterium]
MRTWVKICGITRLEDARAAFDAGADAIGINFCSWSKRCCDPEQARAIVAALPRRSRVYGVFGRTTRQEIERIVSKVGLTGVQLHGEEPVEDAQGWSLPVLRAVGASSRDVLREALECAQDHRVLIDNAAGGGSGRLIDPALLEGLDLSKAVIAGGLTPANVAGIVARLAPFGVDTAGGVETAPGIKDARLVDEFVQSARPHQAASTAAGEAAGDGAAAKPGS